MEYEKIILDLLIRVKTLEEKVEHLSSEKNECSKKQPGIAEIREYIMGIKHKAAEDGLSHIVLKANDIHKAMKLKSRMPAVCSAMKQCMNTGDTVLHEPPSGFSSTLEIQYAIY